MREILARLNQRLSTFLPLAALLIAFMGLFAAGILSAGHLLNLPVPCGRSQGCLTIAIHPSSKVFGVPIAFFGVGAYLATIFLLWQVVVTRWARIACVALTGIGTIISAALLIYSQTVIKATCPWCVASGVAMALLFGLSLLLLKRAQGWPAISLLIVGCLFIVTAISLGVEAGLMQKKANAPPIPAALLATVPAGELVDAAKSIGPPNASVTIIEFADLSCPACRMSHASLTKYQQANPAGVRLVFRHRPFWQIRGHEFSRAAAALSEIAAEQGKFWQFVNAAYSRPGLDRSSSLELMRGLGFDPVEVEARLANPQDAAIARVLRDEELAEHLDINSTPTFVVLIGNNPPISANQHTLPKILNSPELQSWFAPAAPPSGARK